MDCLDEWDAQFAKPDWYGLPTVGSCPYGSLGCIPFLGRTCPACTHFEHFYQDGGLGEGWGNGSNDAL